jgi:transaldolase
MALFLDSASVDDARRAAELGFVSGITTNPALIAATGRPAEDVIATLCADFPGLIFHQVTSPPGPALEAEIPRFRALSNQVGFKIPCTHAYLPTVHRLAQQGLTCAVTGVFGAAQAYVAAEAGARYVIPYVNRATRLCGDGPALVAEMAAVLQSPTLSAARKSMTEILAASIKSPAEAVDTLLSGAHHLTLPWDVLAALAQHRLTDLALDDFAAAAGTAAADTSALAGG